MTALLTPMAGLGPGASGASRGWKLHWPCDASLLSDPWPRHCAREAAQRLPAPRLFLSRWRVPWGHQQVPWPLLPAWGQRRGWRPPVGRWAWALGWPAGVSSPLSWSRPRPLARLPLAALLPSFRGLGGQQGVHVRRRRSTTHLLHGRRLPPLHLPALPSRQPSVPPAESTHSRPHLPLSHTVLVHLRSVHIKVMGVLQRKLRNQRRETPC